MKNEKMTLQAARTLVANLVIQARIPGLNGHHWGMSPKNAFQTVLDGAKSNSWGSQSFSWEQSWGVSLTLNTFWNDGQRVNSREEEIVSTLSCSVSWSSTGRSLTEARAAVVLYSQVIDLACMIESHVNGIAIESFQERFDKQDAKNRAELEVRLEEERSTYSRGFTVLLSNPTKSVSKELYEHLKGNTCGGTINTGLPCKAKSKFAIWNTERAEFVARCLRHESQISVGTE